MCPLCKIVHPSKGYATQCTSAQRFEVVATRSEASRSASKVLVAINKVYNASMPSKPACAIEVCRSSAQSQTQVSTKRPHPQSARATKTHTRIHFRLKHSLFLKPLQSFSAAQQS